MARKSAPMTNRLPLLALAAALSLSACNNDDHTIVAGGPVDPMANQIANAPAVELPPAIAASKSYRCDGNKVVEIDWTERDAKPAGANVRVGENATTPVIFTVAEGSTDSYTAADGSKLTGTKTGTATLTLAGQGALSCKA